MHIVSHVVAPYELSDPEDPHDLDRTLWQYPRITVYSSGGLEALAMLCWVSKAFYCSASRLVFRHWSVRMGHELSIDPRLKALSCSLWAPFVRVIEFNLVDKENTYDVQGCTEAANGENIKASDKTIRSFSSIMAEFSELDSIIVRIEATLTRSLETLAENFFMLLAKSPLKKIKALRIPVWCTEFLHQLLVNSTTTSTGEKLMPELRHVVFDGRNGGKLKNVDILMERNPGLSSLRLLSSTTAIDYPEIEVKQPLQLRCLDLSGVYISSISLLAILEQCKETIRVISLHRIKITTGVWVNFLSFIKTELHLLIFHFDLHVFHISPKSLSMDARKDEGEFLRDRELILHLLSDIHHQTNENRSTVGRKPWPVKFCKYLDVLA